MLSRKNRFSLRTDRLRLEKLGQTRHSPLFIVSSAPSAKGITSLSRFTILVSKKLAPLSVDRHHLKRLVSEILRLNLAKFPLGRDFLLIPKKTILSATPDQILSDLLKIKINEN